MAVSIIIDILSAICNQCNPLILGCMQIALVVPVIRRRVIWHTPSIAIKPSSFILIPIIVIIHPEFSHDGISVINCKVWLVKFILRLVTIIPVNICRSIGVFKHYVVENIIFRITRDRINRTVDQVLTVKIQS